MTVVVIQLYRLAWTSGAGYMLFFTDRYIGYFSQLTSECLVVKETADQRYSVWELPKGKANEALEYRVYAYGALCDLFHMGFKLNARVSIVESEPAKVLVSPPAAVETKHSLELPGFGILIHTTEEKPSKRISQRLSYP